jgi:tryptophanyl-tRNA synthetase
MSTAPTRVFSGIQPTGRKHLGNFLGAIRHYVADQERYGSESIFCIVDLHSMTVPYEPAALRENSLEMATLLMAAGLDPERCILFVQSHVHEHAELCWVLACVATMGELGRMTQFKEKGEGRESVSVGLFLYPVLQAADILVYRANRVPVGEDQRQHLELSRDIAQRFNQRFGETFPLPQASIPPTAQRIKDLSDPERMMSTSRSSDDGKVLVLDEPDAIRQKLRRAVTDSGSEVRAADDKPGVTNLLEILSAVTDRPLAALEDEYRGKGYGVFKADVAEAVIEYLRPTRERYAELARDPAAVRAALERGAERAQAIAAPILAEVKDRVGLVTR